MRITLASTSPYRKALLEKLNLTFECVAPNADETPFPNENPESLAQRLAILKAHSTDTVKDGFIIGSDQVACVNGTVLGKPGNHENAVKQLTQCSGQRVVFYTGLCLLNKETEHYESHVERFEVKFKLLSPQQIVHYVNIETPYFCAGSFKSEGLGILLFEELSGRDPNSLIGLPIIALNELFTRVGIDLLTLAAH